MHFRPLGKTGLNLSVVSYGAASMGNEYGNAADESAASARCTSRWMVG